MIGYIKIAYWWLIPMILIFNATDNQRQSELNEIKHNILIKHPGEEDVVEVVLTEVQNKNGLPVEYFMDVESVICLEEVCKVIPVTIFWNNIGEYQKYTLQEGATLEKYEADFFDPTDYRKLHTILENSNSPFKDVFIEDIWTVPSSEIIDVDAISGATILELDEKDTVPGAALTCYTLWHWANGDIVSVIKNKTGESVSNEQLKEFIANKNETYFNIAIDELEKRKIYQDSFVDLIIQRVLKEELILKEVLSFLEKTPSLTYLEASSKIFFKGRKEQKLAVIQSLKISDIEIPKLYLDRFSEEFSQLDSYQEISALIELIQTKKLTSSIVNSNVLPLLNSDLIIARRAYWFLNNQELTSKQKRTLKTFYRNNKERL